MNDQCVIALYGLGVMGKSLARNMISKGYQTAVYSKSRAELNRFQEKQMQGNCRICQSEEELIGALEKPRKIFLMITAGTAVDEVLDSLLPHLEAGDVLMDGGNSLYQDTNRRCRKCEKLGIDYLGIGVSGGELGALYGPSMMAGGSRAGWEAVRTILTDTAAQFEGTPCCAYVGPQGAGHYVKMVHNGIEYAMLQILAESYHLLRYGLDLNYELIQDIFAKWKTGKLGGYLIDICSQVLKLRESDGTPLIDRILDAGGQKGTGRWTLEEGIARGVYIPTIYEAVAARSFSADREMRKLGNEVLGTQINKVLMHEPGIVLGQALELGMLVCYCQGFELIRKASEEFGWGIQMETLADIWSAGCIIRSEMLAGIKQDLKEQQPVILSNRLTDRQSLAESLRTCVAEANQAGIAVPGLASVMHYYDYYRMERMPVNFMQALRDCFGAHTYQRTDRGGQFHTEWQ